MVTSNDGTEEAKVVDQYRQYMLQAKVRLIDLAYTVVDELLRTYMMCAALAR